MTKGITQYFEDKSRGNSGVWCRVYDNGKRNWQIYKKPEPFYAVDKNADGRIKGFTGLNLSPLKFDDIKAARKFLYSNQDETKQIYGTSNFGLGIVDNLNLDLLTSYMYKIAVFDIETEVSEHGIDPYNTVDPINMITISEFGTNRYLAMTTCANITLEDVIKSLPESDRNIDIDLQIFKSEFDMLEYFVRHLEIEQYDIIGGWYSRGFDIPYCVNRIRKINGQNTVNRMSPFGRIEERSTFDDFGKETIEYTFRGLEHVDFKDLYQLRSFTSHENFRLETITHDNLGTGKLQHPSGIPGHLLYRYPEYESAGLAYNIVDVHRLAQLVDKSNIISQEVALSQMCGINLRETKHVTKLINGFAYKVLRDHRVFLPLAFSEKDPAQVEGGYVYDPKIGLHKYVVSVDLSSSYPNGMMALNISPETVGMKFDFRVDDVIDKIENGKSDKVPSIPNGYTMAANGQCFKKNRIGFMPKILDILYKMRLDIKHRRNEAMSKYAETRDIVHKRQADTHKSNDSAVKVILNSCYGALGSSTYMFYDPDCAEAVTQTGQLALKMMSKSVIEFSSKTKNQALALDAYIKEEDINSVVKIGGVACANKKEYLEELSKHDTDSILVYGDTDSTYMSLAPFVSLLEFEDDTELNRLKLCRWIADGPMQKAIASGMRKVEEATGAVKTGIINADREAIASSAIFTAKKKYCMAVFDMEGAEYGIDNQYLKIQGLSVIQSTTPAKCKVVLKEFLKNVLLHGPEYAEKEIIKFKKVFNDFNINDISPTVSSTNIRSNHFAARAATLYNKLLDESDQQGVYNKIVDNDSFHIIKLKPKNPFSANYIAWLDDYPSSVYDKAGVHHFIDKSAQWNKVVIAQTKNIYNAIGFNPISKKIDF